MSRNKIIKGNFKRNKVVNNNNIDTVNGNIDQSYVDNSVKNYITIINKVIKIMILFITRTNTLVKDPVEINVIS